MTGRWGVYRNAHGRLSLIELVRTEDELEGEATGFALHSVAPLVRRGNRERGSIGALRNRLGTD